MYAQCKLANNDLHIYIVRMMDIHICICAACLAVSVVFAQNPSHPFNFA